MTAVVSRHHEWLPSLSALISFNCKGVCCSPSTSVVVCCGGVHAKVGLVRLCAFHAPRLTAGQSVTFMTACAVIKRASHALEQERSY